MNWLSGYARRAAISIPSSVDGKLTNYQVEFDIVKGSGSNSKNTIYLNNHALNWPKDIRFTSSDGITLIDFWREESDATDGTWWVEVPTVPASGGTTIYLYYRSSGASDVSNGDATFELFDDFPNSSLDTDKWNSSGTISVSSGVCTIGGSGTDSHIREKTERSMPWRIIAKSKIGSLADGPWLVGSDYVNHTLNAYYCTLRARNNNGIYWWCASKNGTSLTTTYSDASDTNFHVAEIRAYSTSKVQYLVDDSLIVEHTTNIPTVGQGIYLRTYTSAASIIDWVAVLKFTANPPSPSAGSPETRPGGGAIMF